jgi:hypothetical protein
MIRLASFAFYLINKDSGKFRISSEAGGITVAVSYGLSSGSISVV